MIGNFVFFSVESFMTINLGCKKCGSEFDCDVGDISMSEDSMLPVFGKDIECPRCGRLSMDDISLTEFGQSRTTKQREGVLQECWLIILIVVVVFLTFLPVLNNEFTWDDTRNIVENSHYRGLTPSHLSWMFTTFYMGHYHPLTWLSFGVDYLVWGMNPTGYHFTNLALHVLNAVVFYFLIKTILNHVSNFRLYRHTLAFKLCCIIGTWFFALHPLRVESVAWVTERRDVLSGLFYMLTIIMYLRMQNEQYRHRKLWYVLSLLFFLASLLSKAWGIMLPFVLLVLDIYPLRRLTAASPSRTALWKKLITEKSLYFLAALCFAVLAIHAQKNWAMGMVADHGLVDRFMQSAFGLCFYIWKTAVPIHLSPLYILSHSFNPTGLKFVFCSIVVSSVTVWLVLMRRRLPWLLAVWICYGIIVSPVLGLAQSGQQIAADRYTYLSCLPFALLVAGSLLGIWIASSGRRMPWPTWFLSAFAIVGFVSALPVLAFKQTYVWHNDGTLWDYAVKHDSFNYTAYNNRGFYRYQQGDYDGALADYDIAIDLDPKYTVAYHNRGVLRQSHGDVTGALSDFDMAIESDSGYVRAYINRGQIRMKLGDLDGARSDLDSAIRLDPEVSITYYSRGILKKIKGDLTGALEDYNHTIRLNPEFARAFNNRGGLHWQFGDAAAALLDFDRAIRLNPKLSDAYNNRGVVQQHFGNRNRALADFNSAIRMNPDDNKAYFSRAALHWKWGNLKKAVNDYSHIIHSNPGNQNAYSNRDANEAYFNRAVVHWEQGDLGQALNDYNHVIHSDPTHQNAYLNRGVLHQKMGNEDGALSDFSTLIRLNPNNPDALINRGNLYLSQGDTDRAIADLTYALKVAPSNWAYRSRAEKLLAHAHNTFENRH
jgi:protein O-mannosyl-transferase